MDYRARQAGTLIEGTGCADASMRCAVTDCSFIAASVDKSSGAGKILPAR
jgi:hypothetical protein